MACNFCKFDLYIKTVQYTKPLLAPLTRTEELRQELLDLTGEVYLQIPNEYCAMCGEKITRTSKERGVDKPKITCLNCRHLMFSDMYGECNKRLRIVNPSDTCEYAEPKERGGEK